MEPGCRPSGTIVVMAHAWYGDMIGGSFRLASEFAEYLAAAGYGVVYVCCDVRAERGQPLRQFVNGVDVRRYPEPGAHLRLGRSLAQVVRSRRVVRHVMRERRVIALSGHSPLQFLGAALAMRGAAAFRNYTVHSPFDDELRCGMARTVPVVTSALLATARILDRTNAHLANRVQTDSAFSLDAMSKKHGACVARKGVVAPGWVDTRAFRGLGARTDVRRRLGGRWSTEEPIFFTLRRLEPRMGLDVLIRAVGRLRNGPPFRVLIGGAGPLRDELSRLVRDEGVRGRVHLLGQLPEELVPLAYRAADCFVLPTRALECFGLIVLEAFAAGSPVLGARTAAIPELASQQGEGWLFDANDVSALAERVKAFLSGELRPTVDVRTIAARYDRSRIQPYWERLLFSGSPTVPYPSGDRGIDCNMKSCSPPS